MIVRYIDSPPPEAATGGGKGTTDEGEADARTTVVLCMARRDNEGPETMLVTVVVVVEVLVVVLVLLLVLVLSGDGAASNGSAREISTFSTSFCEGEGFMADVIDGDDILDESGDGELFICVVAFWGCNVMTSLCDVEVVLVGSVALE